MPKSLLDKSKAKNIDAISRENSNDFPTTDAYGYVKNESLTGKEDGDRQVEARSASGIKKNPAIKVDYHFDQIPLHPKFPQVQAEFTINSPGDKYEQEADAMADNLIRMPDTASIQQKSASVSSIPVKGKSEVIASSSLRNKITKSKGGGRGMDYHTQLFMSKSFGTDFSNVKIHMDHEAAQMNRELNAEAFTTGNDIYFNEGAYNPKSERGKHLLAHELTHVLQQKKSNGNLFIFRKEYSFKVLENSGSANKSINVFSDDNFSASDQVATENTKSNTTEKSLEIRPPKETLEEQKTNNPDEKKEKDESGATEKKEDKPETGSIDKSSSQTILSSWVSSTPINLIQNADEVQQSVQVAQQKEKSTLQKEFPIIQQPTGLPPQNGKQTKASDKTYKTGTPLIAEHQGQAVTLRPPDSETVSTIPVNQQPVPKIDNTAPQEENEEGWFSRILNLIKSFLSSIATVDPTITTSLGPRPKVPLVGDANPSANESTVKDSAKSVELEKQKSNEQTEKDFGEKDINPQVTPEAMSPNVKPSAPSATTGTPTKAVPALKGELTDEFNFNAKAKLDEEGKAAVAKTESEKEKMEADSRAERSEADTLIEEKNSKTKKEQIKEQIAVQKEVEAFKSQWHNENEQISNDFNKKAETEKIKINGQINTLTSDADTKVSKEYASREAEIKAKKKEKEEEAARIKQREENRPRSYWERIKGAVSSVVSAIRSAVNAVIDTLRKAVKGIIDLAKKAAFAIIEAARMAIVGLIKTFGATLKGLVTITFAMFPEVAKKINGKIDSAVNTGVTAVNDAAESLKESVAKILDALGEALDLFLSIYQKAFNLALDVMEFLIVGLLSILELLSDMRKLYEKFMKLIDGIQEVWDNPKIIEDYVQEFLAPYIDKIPEETRQQLTKAFLVEGKALGKHLSGIWRYLTPIFTFMASNWWAEIKKMAWFMIWPFAEGSPLYEDAPKLWRLVPQIWDDVKKGEYSKAADGVLEWVQALNNTLAAFAGWIYIGSILIGAIIGAFFGGAGAIPGAMAGLAVANSIGYGMLVSMLATEAAIVRKAIYDLSVTEDEGGDGSAIKEEKAKENPDPQRALLFQIPAEAAKPANEHETDTDPLTPPTGLLTKQDEGKQENPRYTSSNIETGHDRVEYAYSRIAASGFALAIMVLFMALGAIGGKIAQALGKFGKSVGSAAAKIAPNTTKAVGSAFKKVKTFGRGVGEKYGYKNYGPIKGSAKGNVPKGKAIEVVPGHEPPGGGKQHIDAPEAKRPADVGELKPADTPEAPKAEVTTTEKPEFKTNEPVKEVNEPIQKPDAETKAPETKSESELKAGDKEKAEDFAKKAQNNEGVESQGKTEDGHELKVDKEGRIVECTDCKVYEISHKEILNENPELAKELKDIRKKMTENPHDPAAMKELEAFDSKVKEVEGRGKVDDKVAIIEEPNVDGNNKIEAASNTEGTATKKTEVKANEAIKEVKEPVQKPEEAAGRKKAQEKAQKHGKEKAKKKADSDAKSKQLEKERSGELGETEKRKEIAKRQLTELEKAKAELELELKEREALRVERNEAINEQRELVDKMNKTNDPIERAKLKEKALEAKNRAEEARIKREEFSSPEDVQAQIKKLDLEAERLKIQIEPEKHRAALPCFSGETMVWTKYGTKRIDQIEKGDLIYSFDFNLDKQKLCTVLEVHRNRTFHFYEIFVGDDRIKATGEHPFWVESLQQWIAARDLKAGMLLKLRNGQLTDIKNIVFEKTSEQASYNLSIDLIPNYFVGPGVLVHNESKVVDLGLGGNKIIYRGVNRKFPEKVYIGQTIALDAKGKLFGAAGREKDHRAYAKKELQKLRDLEKLKGGLSPDELKQREFYKFMEDVELNELIRGIDADQANYLEQKNIDIESKLQGEDNVMNRREQIASPKHHQEVEARIREKLQAQGKTCPP